MSGRFAGKRVLVTGAAGFVGANLVAALEAESADVFAMVRAQSKLKHLDSIETRAKLIVVDLLDYPSVQTALADVQPHYVFHAAVGRDDKNWQTTWEMNSAAALNLLLACDSPSLQHFVHCGSSLEYGNIPAPFKEDDRIEPSSLFGASKAAGSLLLRQQAVTRGIPVVILRLFHVYGRFEPDHRLIPSTIRNIMEDRPVTLTAPGLCHDFVHVDDVVEACLMAALNEELTSQIFNIASGKQTANEEVVEMIGSIIGKRAQIAPNQFPARQWDKSSWCGDISLAFEQFGWQPKISLEKGLQTVVSGFRA